jgi:hypothetical protein
MAASSLKRRDGDAALLYVMQQVQYPIEAVGQCLRCTSPGDLPKPLVPDGIYRWAAWADPRPETKIPLTGIVTHSLVNSRLTRGAMDSEDRTGFSSLAAAAIRQVTTKGP